MALRLVFLRLCGFASLRSIPAPVHPATRGNRTDHWLLMPSHSPKTRFDKALRATLIPLLHAEGFVGKLPRLRRVIGKHLVHVIELQGSRLAKGATYVNLGVHLDFLDDPGGFVTQRHRHRATAFTMATAKRRLRSTSRGSSR